MTRTLLIVSESKIVGNLLDRRDFSSNVTIVLDRSPSTGRALRLLLKRRISPLATLKMFFAEIIRKQTKEVTFDHEIESNSDLIELVSKLEPTRIVLFRAGLIIERALFPAGVEIHNIHCASLPDFGGLGSIYKALREKRYAQCATLHKVTDKIDGGQVLDTKSYVLSPSVCYRANEDLAYKRGYELLCETLQD